MSTLKKSQHYVWRKHLRSWSTNDKIWVRIKENQKILETNLMNVAQESFFYKVNDLSRNEKLALKEFIEHNTRDDLKEINLSILNTLTLHSQVREAIKTSHKEIPKEVDIECRRFSINTAENLLTSFENLGNEILSCKCKCDLYFLEDRRKLMDTVMFLNIQYVRTKKMKNSFLKLSSEYPNLVTENNWFFISLFMSNQLAPNISGREGLRFTILINNTNKSFLTGDQPIINQRVDQRDSSGNVQELEYYYPISPTRALMVDFKGGDKYCELELTEKDVLNYNNMIIEESNMFLFSNNNESLKI